MSSTDSEILRFKTYCGLTGKRYHTQVVRHNGRIAAAINPHSLDQLVEAARPHFSEKEKFYVNLNPIERRTWYRILNGWNIAAIARDEKVSDAAIRARIQGNSKGQGGMIAKNVWVLLWWTLRQKLSVKNPRHRYEITD